MNHFEYTADKQLRPRQDIRGSHHQPHTHSGLQYNTTDCGALYTSTKPTSSENSRNLLSSLVVPKGGPTNSVTDQQSFFRTVARKESRQNLLRRAENPSTTTSEIHHSYGTTTTTLDHQPSTTAQASNNKADSAVNTTIGAVTTTTTTTTTTAQTNNNNNSSSHTTNNNSNTAHQHGGNKTTTSTTSNAIMASTTSRNAMRNYSTTKIYEIGSVLGNGSFGIVCEAICLTTGEKVAIKKVLQDPRYKNRELDIMKQLFHPNVVTLKDYFYTEGPTSDGEGVQRFLSVVMEFIPETVYKVLKQFVKKISAMPMAFVKVYAYQMLRSVGYLHSLGVCHRDIKPQNLLVDSRSHVLKLCDFGSAKRLLSGESSVSYICSRFYRAPELMLGATQYTCAIDTWSLGCVLGEFIIGKPLFAGETSVDQLVKILRVLGTPNQAQLRAMNREYSDFNFPEMKPQDLRFFIPNSPDNRIPDSAYDLLGALLKLVPQERIKPYDALAHAFFDQLREPDFLLPDGVEPPELFNFSDHELAQMSPATRGRVIPVWYSSNPPSGATFLPPSGCVGGNNNIDEPLNTTTTVNPSASSGRLV